ncbi:hypothetical protein P175DRAFT_0499081 [Aspergillus ochraceoroseus IBT 24754]|uniref:DNA replication regulator Sld3 C-terminal domain-containing protein n=2 Tax=Aspergillus ochraceoroseus TaxID=138278 RepID=A0A2T5M1Z0_9EURO|nr:uncharacterized protein P175DRAFT_0499081 [Aspergillus ochraceoroseus IBT 24754]KKK24678.1 hypothetical protein AOCH_004905 [Aspergillus ochraceoroseus]PTU22554.1 hypothetical protein P175DRAFT_0499081 [Aspergillus ochraceoroseus IBT 24754]
MASRESLNVLEHIPLNRLQDPAPPISRKRKICDLTDDSEAQNIVIRAHAASLSDDPFVLQPIAVLPRTRLPFDWLDIPSVSSPIQSGSLFMANIPVLESNPPVEPIVLVVRLITDGALYAIERVKQGVYALSQLARGVEEGDIRVAVKASSRPVSAGLGGRCTPLKGRNAGCPRGWWQVAEIEDPAPNLDAQIATKRVKVNFAFGVTPHLMERHETQVKDMPPTDPMDRSSSCDLHQMLSALPETQEHHTEPVGAQEMGEDPCPAAQSPQELLDGLREQYLQALYVSKASVAYFAKGPLPRCRAAFQSPVSSSYRSSHLTEFYREAILPVKKMDLKYRETLPAIIQDVMLAVSDDEMAGPKKRQSKKKKKTLGKNGLYSEEDQFIRQWWKNRPLTETGALVETSREAELKKHVSDLRLRETQLQILLILEAMALEAAATDAAKTVSIEATTSDQNPPKPRPKTKKPQDLNVILELHLDRLCIWHAVGFGDTAISDLANSGSNPPSSKPAGNDAMRDFCTEVIIPFYASRLPDRCKSITRKLGVSVGTKSPFAKSSSRKISRGEPGAAIERHSSQKHPRRTLQTDLTTNEQTASQGRSRPSLSRSNTVSSQPEAGRNSLAPLLPVLSTSVRGGIQKAKRAENREVDLIAVARQHETKLKRVQLLADQKKELDAAILALRKPNRELVAQDIANDADKRLTTSGSSRKPKNPVRNPFQQGVQVMATPKGSRKKDAVIGLPPLPKSLVRSSPKARGSSTSFSSPFSGEPQVIPGSTVRPSSFSGASLSTDVGAVQETPSRRPAQPPNSLNDATGLNVAESPSFPGTGNLFRVPRRPAAPPLANGPCTPVAARHVNVTDADADADADADVDRHLDASRSRAPPPPPLFSLSGIKATPVKSSTVLETPPKPGAGSLFHSGGGRPVVPVTPEKSIYAHLGWDDDDSLIL